MNPEYIIAIIEFIIALGAVVGVYVSLAQRITRVETKMEIFIDGLGKNLVSVLHRDDNLHGLDEIFDKYRMSHILSYVEWHKVKEFCDKVVIDKSVNVDVRTGYALLGQICQHKMTPQNRFWQKQEAFVHHD